MKQFFSSINLAVFFVLSFFLLTIHQELFHYLQVGFFISVHISKVYVMSSPTSQSSPSFHSFFNKENAGAETATKLNFISSIWDDDHIQRLDENTVNAYGVIKILKESMLLRLLLTYWGRRVCILKIVMLLKTKLTQQDTKKFSITNRLRRVLFLIIQKRLEHQSQVYRISHLLPLNPPSIGVPKVSLHQMTLIHL